MTDLEQRLRSLGDQIDWPPAADMTARVQQRIASRSLPRRRVTWRPVVLAGLAIVIVTLSLSPGARQAIARLLGVAGVRIETKVATTLPPTLNLDLGTEVDAAEVGESVEFRILTGSLDTLGAPDAIYFDDRRLGGQVSLLWAPGPGLPKAADAGVGLLISSFEGGLDPSTYSKELNPSRNLLLDVEVRGVRGFWIEGEPHVFLYEDEAGNIEFESIRLAGNVLLWEEDGVTIRIESALPLDDVLRIAESLIPLTYPVEGG